MKYTKNCIKVILLVLLMINCVMFSVYADDNETITISTETTGEEIGVREYAGNNDVKYITIESGVTTINDEAFSDCPNLEKITIPNTVYYISEAAFWTDCDWNYDNITICGASGSYAQEYAEKYGINFESTGKSGRLRAPINRQIGKYSLEEERIINNLSQYSDLYNDTTMYNGVKVAVKSAMNRLEQITSSNSKTFAFITDTHLNNGTNDGSESSISAYKALARSGKIKYGVVGGDLYSSYASSMQDGINLERHAVDKFSESQVPLLFVKGNHECNEKTGTDQRITNSKLTQIYNSGYEATGTTNIVYDSNNPDGLYFYKDDEGSKIRYCVLNGFEGSSETETVFSDTQLSFIANNMLNFSSKSTPSQWHVVFFIHRFNDGSSKTKLNQIITAFKNGGSVSVANQTVSYASQGQGNFIALIGGDVHEDRSYNGDGYWYINTDNSFSEFDSSRGETSPMGSAMETAIDIFTVDTTNKKLYATRVGKGKDREWNYGSSNWNLTESRTYNSSNNSVTLTVSSNVKLKDTKPTWTLSADGYSYTKTFYKNESYSTTFTREFQTKTENYVPQYETQSYNINIYGLSSSGFITNMAYKHNDDNTITCIVYSNVPMAATKPTWNLSADGYEYSKTFDTNQSYSTNFQSQSGIVKSLPISITQVDSTGPIVNISTINNSNGSITVVATSNEKFGDTKPTWVLSEDGKTYQKTLYESFTTAGDGTIFEDIYGNQTKRWFSYNPGNLSASYQIGYVFNCFNGKTAVVNGSIPLQSGKETWTCSPDCWSYHKNYSQNYNSTTYFTDMFGHSYGASIAVTGLDDGYAPNVNIQYTNNNDGTVTVTIISNEKLQDKKVTWQLSADRMTYRKTYSAEEVAQHYSPTSTFTDLYGHESGVYTITL